MARLGECADGYPTRDHEGLSGLNPVRVSAEVTAADRRRRHLALLVRDRPPDDTPTEPAPLEALGPAPVPLASWRREINQLFVEMDYILDQAQVVTAKHGT